MTYLTNLSVLVLLFILAHLFVFGLTYVAALAWFMARRQYDDDHHARIINTYLDLTTPKHGDRNHAKEENHPS